jgi:hypothetical protein
MSFVGRTTLETMPPSSVRLVTMRSPFQCCSGAITTLPERVRLPVATFEADGASEDDARAEIGTVTSEIEVAEFFVPALLIDAASMGFFAPRLSPKVKEPFTAVTEVEEESELDVSVDVFRDGGGGAVGFTATAWLPAETITAALLAFSRKKEGSAEEEAGVELLGLGAAKGTSLGRGTGARLGTGGFGGSREGGGILLGLATANGMLAVWAAGGCNSAFFRGVSMCGLVGDPGPTAGTGTTTLRSPARSLKTSKSSRDPPSASILAFSLAK